MGIALFEELRGADAVRRGGAADAEEICREVHADRREGFLVLRPEQFFGERFEETGNAAGDAALFPKPHEAEPRRIGGQQGEAEGGAAACAVEEGGQESGRVEQEKQGGRKNENDGEYGIHIPILCPCPAKNDGFCPSDGRGVAWRRKREKPRFTRADGKAAERGKGAKSNLLFRAKGV